MATRGKKTTRTTTVTTTTVNNASGDAAPVVDIDEESFESNTSRRSYRNRVNEKQALSELNDRLANYIEKVRSLEAENNRLQVQIREIEVVERRERDSSNNDFKQKIIDLRQALDEANQARSRAELDRKNAEAALADQRKKATKAENDLRLTTAERDRLAEELAKAKQHLQTSESRRFKIENEHNEIKNELDIALKQIDTLKIQLEDETLLRSELQTKVNDLREDLDLEKRQHQQELDEVYRKREIEMNTMGEQLETHYDNELQLRVQEFRAESDARIKQSRKEVEEKFSRKLKELQDSVDYNRQEALQLREQLNSQRSALTEVESERADLNRRIDGLKAQIRELEARLRVTTDLNAAKDAQIDDLRREIERLTAEYKDLMDVKLQLDEELSTYHMLLQAEESRLKIRTPDSTADEELHVSFDDQPKSRNASLSFSAAAGSSPRRGVKRRRLAEENINDFNTSYERLRSTFRTNNQADGDLIVQHVDPEGAFVRLENKGTEDLPLGGYKVVVKDNEREVTFKFSPKVVLKPTKQITIFSSNTGEHQHLPTKVTLKNQNWPAGNDYRLTEVFDSDGTRVASSESYKDTSGRSYATDGDERCSIM
ncbi:hypothetical protein M3Y96_00142700 [Aphelenchoides besseyi]|nr:hypothetical protein M3Y96_00142700 [Aphelenchoides besseyi]